MLSDMKPTTKIKKHERTISKVVLVISIVTLVVLGSTILAVNMLRPGPNGLQQAHGWQRTPEIRIVMDSTADWARIMFNDFYQTNTNGIRVLQFGARGWLAGNHSDDRIDAGHDLTFVDIVYNSTVVRTGDIVGFFKGNNDFSHTRMYADVVLEVNEDMGQVSIYIMLAGAGTTTFEFINKGSGQVVWQDTQTGNSFTQYTRRWMSPDIFFMTTRIDLTLVFALAAGAVITLVALNPVIFGRKNMKPIEDSEGL
jgi:hypothetical protein